MRKNELLNFDLLKIAILNKDYLASINKNKETQYDFINTLTINQFTYQQILELMASVQDTQVKSLLIIYLLSQKDYLDSLKGESFLVQLAKNETHTPSRLNALVHQLNQNCLTLDHIELLQPEALATLLCSIPHFHHLSDKQVEKILLKYPKPNMIAYWLNHYASKPNAHFILAHLMKLVDVHVVEELGKMDASKKETIITNMLEHLELFNPTHPLLLNQNEEKRLIFSIQRYFYGHHNENYVTYINLLVDKLLSNNRHFSAHALQLLISLNNLEEFKDLNNKIAYLTNYYLRISAQSGDISLFYNDLQINITSMTQLLQLSPPLPHKSKEQSFLSSLLCGIKIGETSIEVPENDIPEHPLISKLIKNRRTVKSFDYFLMHFKGEEKQLYKIINDYLSYYVQEGGTETHRRSIYHLVVLMSLSDISISVRETLFKALLNYPELFDEQISYSLCVYDVKRVIKHFSKQKGENSYIKIIDLCDLALKKLNPNKHQDIINIATKTREEAKLELSFSNTEGFFAQWIKRLKRCWYYGWTGFFLPKPPTFVVAFDSLEKEDVNEEPLLQQRKYLTANKPEINLSALLKTIKSDHNQQKLNELIEALNVFSLQTNPPNEFKIRTKLHHLFHELLLESQNDPILDSWLIKNQQFLIANRFRLLEMQLINGCPIGVESLLKEFNEDSSHFHSISDEFNDILPEQNPSNSESASYNKATATTLLGTATEFATNLKNTLGTWGGFFTNNLIPSFYPKRNTTASPTSPRVSA
ncbi:type IV secretion protein Dot [Legionella norrlandica]|uniref:Type IV secretion protein Dot n=1 Tax=Legionella norrlandica TaxID=1498499 RepID=A0A0A2SPX8_9GAMM|nr:type IV secretion protein Dot [Legionella norrlandica]KGP62802.1 type IV secretion protein Dot [Legionella norrlandica]